jgi:hypothetical protein
MSRRCLGTLNQPHLRLSKRLSSSKHNNLPQHPSLYRMELLSSTNLLRTDMHSLRLNLAQTLSLCTAIPPLSKDILSR